MESEIYSNFSQAGFARRSWDAAFHKQPSLTVTFSRNKHVFIHSFVSNSSRPRTQLQSTIVMSGGLLSNDSLPPPPVPYQLGINFLINFESPTFWCIICIHALRAALDGSGKRDSFIHHDVPIWLKSLQPQICRGMWVHLSRPCLEFRVTVCLIPNIQAI